MGMIMAVAPVLLMNIDNKAVMSMNPNIILHIQTLVPLA